MKKTALVAAFAALLLAGCSTTSSSDTVDTVADNFQTQDYQAPVQTPEEQYLEDVKAQNNADLMDESDYDLLNVGYQTCEVLDSGYSIGEMVQYLLSDNPSESDIKYMSIIIGNAVEYLCPEYMPQLDSY